MIHFTGRRGKAGVIAATAALAVGALALSHAGTARSTAIRVADAAADGTTASAAATTGNANRDSLITALQSAQPVRYSMTDASGRSMDTAKIIQAGGTYYAVYSPGSQSVVLASSPTLYGTWTPLVTLDDNNASQPYLAQMSDGSFVLADEYVTDIVSDSAVNFKHYASLSTLSAGQSDYSYQTSLSLSGCHEGTPDIHSTDLASIQVGFHYNSSCLGSQLDREAFGTLTGFTSPTSVPSWTATSDTVRDAALNNAATPWTNPSGYPGKHGGRDDLLWRGNRYSLGEAQNSAETSLYTNWRWTLYDYSNDTAYPVVPRIPSSCVANPKVSQVTDTTDGSPVLVVTSFIFGGSAGCAAANEGGEFMEVVPAQ
jgi:hypothetical protein